MRRLRLARPLTRRRRHACRLGLEGVVSKVRNAPYRSGAASGELSRITFGNCVRAGEPADAKALAGKIDQLLDPAMSWPDVDALRAVWTGPLILKGIMHPEEAREAVEHGIDAVIVSNHGGRQLDGAAALLDVLSAVAQAVDGRIPVLFFDGGVRRGSDVLKALALGARACLIGWPQLWALSVAGEAGISHLLDNYRSDGWLTDIALEPTLHGAPSLRQTKATVICPSSEFLRQMAG